MGKDNQSYIHVIILCETELLVRGQVRIKHQSTEKQKLAYQNCTSWLSKNGHTEMLTSVRSQWKGQIYKTFKPVAALILQQTGKPAILLF